MDEIRKLVELWRKELPKPELGLIRERAAADIATIEAHRLSPQPNTDIVKVSIMSLARLAIIAATNGGNEVIAARTLDVLNRMYDLQWDGDSLEMGYWGHIGPLFSNYEEFWRRFVCPATTRPLSIDLRRGIHGSLEEVCMAHYSVFFHFCKAWDFQRNQNRMEDFFIHLSSVHDMVDQLLFALWHFWIDLCDGKLKRALPWKGKQAAKETERFNEFMNSKYPKRLDKFATEGKPVAYPLHSVQTASHSLLRNIDGHNRKGPAWKAYAELNTLFQKHVTPYRNLLVHSPLLGRIQTEEGFILLPKADRLIEGQYRRWHQVFDCIPSTVQEDFEPYLVISQWQLEAIAKSANQVWHHIIRWLARICKNHDGRFRELCGKMPTGESLQPEHELWSYQTRIEPGWLEETFGLTSNPNTVRAHELNDVESEYETIYIPEPGPGSATLKSIIRRPKTINSSSARSRLHPSNTIDWRKGKGSLDGTG